MAKKRDKDLLDRMSPIPDAEGVKTPRADFDRNRDGLYGGLPKARDPRSEGPPPKDPHPPR